MILMIFMAASLLRSLRTERRQQELHEAMTRERLLRLLDRSDHLGESERPTEFDELREELIEQVSQGESSRSE